MSTIRWLHLSDLHIGNKLGMPLWSTFRESFYQDVRRQLNKIGPIHFVLFTGDLVQSGDESEFSSLSRELEGLWKLFSGSGCTPQLLTIPGNHDLKRPNPKDPIAKLIARWQEDEDVRSEFWNRRDSKYRELIDNSFSAYMKWLANPPVPLHDRISGDLPGDFSSVVEVDRLRIGIIGLNSSFLQLGDGDYEGRLEINETQILAVTQNKPDEWANKNHANFLLTHHPPSWIERSARNRYRSEIYVPRRFTAHIFGHMHSPTTETLAEGGATPRRSWQAPALFGLKTYRSSTREMDRSHGYWLGSLEKKSAGIEYHIWPREGRPGIAGDWRLAADTRFDLNESDCVSEKLISPVDIADIIDQPTDTLIPALESVQSGTKLEDSEPSALVRDEPNTAPKMQNLAQEIPTWNLRPQPYHRHIRVAEQQLFLSSVQNQRTVWIAADWGLGKDGFLWSCLHGSDATFGPLYRIDCESGDNVDEIHEITSSQLGVSFQQLSAALATVERPVLILDNVAPAITSSATATKDIERLATAFVDYVPQAKIILNAREKPIHASVRAVVLQPLDEAECGKYIADHPDGGRGLIARHELEKIYARSEGIPMHLDELLLQLRTISIDELPIVEQDSDLFHEEPVPRSLIQTIEQLKESRQKYAPRTIRLLKVLSVLSAGETYARVQRFYPTEPFWQENVNELSKAGLVDALPIVDLIQGWSANSPRNSEASAQKLLVVPRPVRDYVRSVIAPTELEEIVEKAASLYFGDRWKEQQPSIVRLPPSVSEGGSGLSNPHRVATHLIRRAIRENDGHLLARAVTCAAVYVKAISAAKRIRESLLASEEVISILDSSGHIGETAPFWSVYAYGLRISGEHQRATDAIEKAVRAADDGQLRLPAELRAKLYLELAFARRASGDPKSAVASAQKVRELAKPDTGLALQAEALLIQLQIQGPDQKGRLMNIEETARRQGAIWVANNILISMANNSSNPKDGRELLDRVLNSSGDDQYNLTRALVMKARSLVKHGKINEITLAERRGLERAYSYLFSQRLGSLFDMCHEVLWELASSEKHTSILLRIFRHSSFLWRLFGKEDHERGYLNKLAPLVPVDQHQGTNRLEVVYYVTRFRSIIPAPRSAP